MVHVIQPQGNAYARNGGMEQIAPFVCSTTFQLNIVTIILIQQTAFSIYDWDYMECNLGYYTPPYFQSDILNMGYIYNLDGGSSSETLCLSELE